MLYEIPPKDFEPILEAVGCFIKCDGKILVLHRQNHRPEGNTWGLPAGKIDNGENMKAAIIREIQEETGLKISDSEVAFIKKFYVRYPDYDSIFNVFETNIRDGGKIKIDKKEHKNFQWISPEDALKLDLIEDLGDVIRLLC